VIVFFVIKDLPSDKEKPLSASQSGSEKGSKEHRETVQNKTTMIVAVLLLGTLGLAGFSHLGVLYASEGFDSIRVSFILSFAGIMITIGKVFYGYVTDKIGAYKSSVVFFSLLVIGAFLCSLAGIGGFALALISMLFLGLGIPLATVGLGVFARNVGEPQEYAGTIKELQTAYLIGGILFSFIPGLLADHTGSYVPSFLILALFSVSSMVLVLKALKMRNAALSR